MQAGFPPVIIPVEQRTRYYLTLQQANEGDLRPFIRFIAEQTERTLDVGFIFFYFKVFFRNLLIVLLCVI